MGDPVLGAVQDPLLSIFFRHASHPHGVASRVGFRQSPSSDPLARRQLGQPPLLLFFIAKLQNVARAQAVVSRHRQPNGTAHFGQLFDGHLVFVIGQPCSPIFCGHQHPHQPKLPHGSKQFPWKVLCLVPLHAVRQDFSLGKVADAVADQPLVGGQCELHGFLSLRTAKVAKVPPRPSVFIPQRGLNLSATQVVR